MDKAFVSRDGRNQRASSNLWEGTHANPIGHIRPRATMAAAIMLETRSSGEPFDESISRPWTDLAELYPTLPIPKACLSCTLELRGHSDVELRLAQADINDPLQFLKRNVIEGATPSVS